MNSQNGQMTNYYIRFLVLKDSWTNLANLFKTLLFVDDIIDVNLSMKCIAAKFGMKGSMSTINLFLNSRLHLQNNKR